MKKVIFVGLVFMLSACSSDNSQNSKGGVWEKASTFFTTTRNNTSAYNVEAAGWNLRAVEWTPADNKNIRCVFVSGTNKGGTACYPVSK